jgi:CHASE2 domain-containing sensor protein
LNRSFGAFWDETGVWLRAQWRRIKPILPIILVVAAFVGDALGIRGSSERFSLEFVERVQAPFYRSMGQERILTVILDDESLEKLKSPYPMPFADHARILRNILCEGPAAVLITINFRYLRGEADGLDLLYNYLSYRRIGDTCQPQSRRELERADLTKVYIGYIPGVDGTCSPFTGNQPKHCVDAIAISRLSEVASTVDLTGTTAGGNYNLSIKSADGSWRISPALAVYLGVCNFIQDATPCPSDHSAFSSEIILKWGYYPPRKSNMFRVTKPCRRSVENTAYLSRLRDAAGAASRMVWHEGIWQMQDYYREQNCTFIPELAASTFIEPAQADNARSKLTHGSVVIYGVQVTGMNDSIISPVHGPLAGVHAHATAIENLLTSGDRYTRTPPKILPATNVNLKHVLELSVALLSLAIEYLIFKKWRAHGGSITNVTWLAAFFCLCAFAHIVTTTLNWSPLNIFGIAFAALFLKWSGRKKMTMPERGVT